MDTENVRRALRATIGGRTVYAAAVEPLGELDYTSASVQCFATGQTSGLVRIPLTTPVLVCLASTDRYSGASARTGWNGHKQRTAATTIEVTAVLVCSPDDRFSFDVDGHYRGDKLYYVGTKMAGKPGAYRPHAKARPDEWREIRGDFSASVERTFTAMAER
jgi:hypothetical protein